MSQWVICSACGLKHRPQAGVCPRCDRPVSAGQTVFTTDLSDPPTENSALAVAVPVGLLLAGLGGFAFLGPLGGRAAGAASISAVLLGLLLLCVGWVWTITLALRVSRAWFGFALFVPYVSVMVMGKLKPFFLKLAGTGLVAAGVFFAPISFGAQGPAQRVARACVEKGAVASRECACIGTKTVELMSPAERQAEVDADSPQTRDLMLTAESLCRKELLTARCVSEQQGTPALCACVTNGAVDAFTPEELEEMLARVAQGAMPDRYAAIRAACVAKLPKR